MITGAIGAIAFIALAAAANDLFAATEDSVPRRRKHGVLTVLLAAAGLQLLTGMQTLLPAAKLYFLGNCALLAVPLAFWPVVARLKRGRIHVVNKRLAQRAERGERAAKAAQTWLELAEQTGHVGHWRLSVPEDQLYWSDEIYRIHGLWREHYTPRLETALAALHPLDGKRVGELLRDVTARRGNFEVAARLRRPDGEIRHIILRGFTSQDETGRVEALHGVMVDVSEPKRAEARWQMAPGTRADIPFEDPVTGLVDRGQFENCLAYEFKRAVRSHKPLGMVLLEIDDFRELAAFYGEMESDACLRAVAQSVQAVPRRAGDVVARYLGPQIAVLLPLADAPGAQRVASQIIEAIRGLGLPNAGTAAGLLSVSCGAAAFAGPDDLYDPAELPRRAARALAGAKAAGGNRVHTLHTEELLQALAQRV